jgi:hypothetical protein
MSLILNSTFENEDDELIWPLFYYKENEHLIESDYFESAAEGESEELWDEAYDKFYRVKNLNEIPKKEVDWHTDINKYYKFDKNVGKFGAWVIVNKRQRIPEKFVYAIKQREIKKKIKGLIKQWYFRNI